MWIYHNIARTVCERNKPAPLLKKPSFPLQNNLWLCNLILLGLAANILLCLTEQLTNFAMQERFFRFIGAISYALLESSFKKLNINNSPIWFYI